MGVYSSGAGIVETSDGNWEDLENILEEDGLVATHPDPGAKPLVLKDFSALGIPSISVPIGYELRFVASGTESNHEVAYVTFKYNNATLSSKTWSPGTYLLPNPTIGGPTDDWGITPGSLTADQIQSELFTIEVEFDDDSLSGSDDTFVDFIEFIVYTTGDPPPPPVYIFPDPSVDESECGEPSIIQLIYPESVGDSAAYGIPSVITTIILVDPSVDESDYAEPTVFGSVISPQTLDDSIVSNPSVVWLVRMNSLDQSVVGIPHAYKGIFFTTSVSSAAYGVPRILNNVFSVIGSVVEWEVNAPTITQIIAVGTVDDSAIGEPGVGILIAPDSAGDDSGTGEPEIEVGPVFIHPVSVDLSVVSEPKVAHGFSPVTLGDQAIVSTDFKVNLVLYFTDSLVGWIGGPQVSVPSVARALSPSTVGDSAAYSDNAKIALTIRPYTYLTVAYGQPVIEVIDIQTISPTSVNSSTVSVPAVARIANLPKIISPDTIAEDVETGDFTIYQAWFIRPSSVTTNPRAGENLRVRQILKPVTVSNADDIPEFSISVTTITIQPLTMDQSLVSLPVVLSSNTISPGTVDESIIGLPSVITVISPDGLTSSATYGEPDMVMGATIIRPYSANDSMCVCGPGCDGLRIYVDQFVETQSVDQSECGTPSILLTVSPDSVDQSEVPSPLIAELLLIAVESAGSSESYSTDSSVILVARPLSVDSSTVSIDVSLGFIVTVDSLDESAVSEDVSLNLVVSPQTVDQSEVSVDLVIETGYMILPQSVDDSEISLDARINQFVLPASTDQSVVSTDSTLALVLAPITVDESTVSGEPEVLRVISPVSVDQSVVSTDALLTLFILPITVDQSAISDDSQVLAGQTLAPSSVDDSLISTDTKLSLFVLPESVDSSAVSTDIQLVTVISVETLNDSQVSTDALFTLFLAPDTLDDSEVSTDGQILVGQTIVPDSVDQSSVSADTLLTLFLLPESVDQSQVSVDGVLMLIVSPDSLDISEVSATVNIVQVVSPQTLDGSSVSGDLVIQIGEIVISPDTVDESSISTNARIDLTLLPNTLDDSEVSEDIGIKHLIAPDSVEGSAYSTDLQINLRLFVDTLDSQQISDDLVVSTDAGFTDWYRFTLGWWSSP